MERGGAAAHGDGVIGADRARDRRLELHDRRTGRQPSGSKRAHDRRHVVVGDVVMAVRQEVATDGRSAVQCELAAFQFLRQGTV